MNDPHYQLLIVSSARRHLTEDLPEAVATAAFEFINRPLLENPHRVGKQLRPPLADRHSARRGTYRVLYRIDDRARAVTVLAIGHRGASAAPDRPERPSPFAVEPKVRVSRDG